MRLLHIISIVPTTVILCYIIQRAHVYSRAGSRMISFRRSLLYSNRRRTPFFVCLCALPFHVINTHIIYVSNNIRTLYTSGCYNIIFCIVCIIYSWLTVIYVALITTDAKNNTERVPAKEKQHIFFFFCSYIGNILHIPI